MPDNYKEMWDKFRSWIDNYGKFHKPNINEKTDEYGRYCVAISCEDLLKKMDEIEDKK